MSTTPATLPQHVLDFWFVSATPHDWFAKNDSFDTRIRQRFGECCDAALAGELATWRTHPSGRLAEIIVLDQFSRNLYRDSARQFAADPMALALAQEAIAGGQDQALSAIQRSFLYLPFMHSESALIHQDAVRLYTELGLPNNLEFERRHHAIIARFGRYPHRNALLGRVSTAEELDFLNQPNSHF
jgi:uncharacterized protein (DUF924 family)